MQEIWVRSRSREDPLEKEVPTHTSILAWEIPWTQEPGGLQSMESQRVRHDLLAKQQQHNIYSKVPKSRYPFITQIKRHTRSSTLEGSHLCLPAITPRNVHCINAWFGESMGSGSAQEARQFRAGCPSCLHHLSCVPCRYDVDSKSPDLSKHVSSASACPAILKVS